MENLKYKTPFIYKLGNSYYVIGFHVCQPYRHLSGINTYEEYLEHRDRASFNRVIDCASVVPQSGDVDTFLSEITPSERASIQEQYNAYLEMQDE